MHAKRLTVLFTAALLLGACAGKGDSAKPASPSSPSSPSSPASSASPANSANPSSPAHSASTPAATFPATVRGAYGDITVSKKPERVLALIPTMGVMLHALGVEPVAVATGEDPAPWFSSVLKNTDPNLAPKYQVKVEAVARHQPDLVVGFNFVLPEPVYKQVSAIAPTYAPTAINPDWQDTLKVLAQLTGTTADPVLAKVDSMCEAARKEIPQWQGKTYNWAATQKGTLAFGNGKGLECFGLKPAANQNNLNDGSGVTLENLNELAGDLVLIWDYENLKDRIEKDPRFAKLPSKANGSLTYIDFPVAYALNAPDGPDSFGYLIEKVLPILKASKP